ncbi:MULTISPECIES: hypothetical protein [Paraburkholderia]|uniref:hypothetical protein n=1 Tax=Paraburkholderia TaxID=1822464 RepID=UPI0018DAFA93|nr:hypothetical protein [Paraburkholderia graminis]MDR6466795.1 hypothetical protein [Paraburkholderia graminis]MDR6473929.1 hypothetical protein [Paraburkholderia graminis]
MGEYDFIGRGDAAGECATVGDYRARHRVRGDFLPVSANPPRDLFLITGLDVDASRDAQQAAFLRAPLKRAVEAGVTGREDNFIGLSFFDFEGGHGAGNLSLTSFHSTGFVVYQLKRYPGGVSFTS